MRKEKQVITSSRIKDFRRCLRRHFYNYILGIDNRTADRRALDFGTFCHAMLEELWGGKTWEEVQALTLTTGSMNDYAIASGRVLCLNYSGFWDQSEWETVATELQFDLPLRNPQTLATSRTYRLSGKIDAIAINRRTGKCWIIEHKTSSMDISPGSPYWQRLFLDEQISTYIYAGKELGFNPVGCIYDVLRKPSIKPLQATPVENRKYDKNNKLYKNHRLRNETPVEYADRFAAEIAKNPNKYFSRGEITRSEKDLFNFQRSVWNVSQEMLHNARKDIHTKNSEACFKYNTPCKFFDLCCESSNLADSRWVKKERIHSELGDSNESKT